MMTCIQVFTAKETSWYLKSSTNRLSYSSSLSIEKQRSLCQQCSMLHLHQNSFIFLGDIVPKICIVHLRNRIVCFFIRVLKQKAPDDIIFSI